MTSKIPTYLHFQIQEDRVLNDPKVYAADIIQSNYPFAKNIIFAGMLNTWTWDKTSCLNDGFTVARFRVKLKPAAKIAA